MTDDTPRPSAHRPRVAIAGAGGFIGTALCRDLAESFEILALTRSASVVQAREPDPRVTWRACDLFSLEAVKASLTGIEYAIYLIHSQAPCSRLTQAKPADMDLVLADNFAQAAAANGLRQIIVVGGLIPDGFRISRLLWSRREVEMVLAARGTPVTALRAGLVVGPGGSSPRLLVDLVRRLPVIPLPPAAHSMTRPIALRDLIRAIGCCLGHPDRYRGHFDIGGPECLSYATMLRQTAQVLGKRRVILTVPFMPLGFAAFAARLVSGAPPSLVGPVIESLPQDTIMRDNPLQQIIDAGSMPFREALANALDPQLRRLSPSPQRPAQGLDRMLIRRASLVRSIQRLILPPGQDAAWVAGNYFRWLERGGWPFVTSAQDSNGSWTLSLRCPRLRLIRLCHMTEQSTPQRQIYRITGGLLSRTDGPGCPRFEFQTLLGDRYTMAAIHDYAPALPWYLYRLSQAIFHRWVMRRYQRHLARLAQ